LFLLSPYNLEPRKNLAGLVRAFACLRPQFPPLRLVLFGNAAWTPERENAFNALIDGLGVRAAVIRLGCVTDAELRWLYRHATLFAFPSCYEGFGLPVLEAMANGGCVVVRNASAMVEVVGDAGALVETIDTPAFAVCIAALLRDPTRRGMLGSAARHRAASFTVERMARLTYESYRQALVRHSFFRPRRFGT
jgi:glycosyltransferase involved in cell wall biosynthesis